MVVGDETQRVGKTGVDGDRVEQLMVESLGKSGDGSD